MNPAVGNEKALLGNSQDQIFRATVVAVDGNEVSVSRDGGAGVTEGPYPTADGLPAVSSGDEVIVLRVGTGYFVSARVLRN